jgi:hypothetical protein
MSALLSKKRIEMLKRYGWTKESIGDALDVMDEMPWADFDCSDGLLWSGDGHREFTLYPSGECTIEWGRVKRTVRTEDAGREISNWNGA